MQNRPKKLIVVTAIIVALLLMVRLLFLGLTFRVTKIVPDPSSIATSTPYLEIHTNKTLASNPPKVSSEQDAIHSVEVKDKVLRINLKPLERDQDYQIEIAEIKSTAGKTIKSQAIKFQAAYIAFEELPEAQQERILENQDRPSASKDEVINLLPYYHEHYELQPRITEGVPRPDILFVYLPTTADLDEGHAAKERYLEDARKYLESKGISLDVYRLIDDDEETGVDFD